MSGNGNAKGQNASGTKGGDSKASKIIDALLNLIKSCGHLKDVAEGDLVPFRDLLEENKDLKSKVEAKDKEIQRLRNAGSKLKAENNTLAETHKAELEALQADKNTLADTHKAELETQKKKYDADIELFYATFAEQASRWKEDANARKKQEKEIAELNAKATKAENENIDLRQKLAQETTEAQKFKTSFNDVSKEKVKLETKLQENEIRLNEAYEHGNSLIKQREAYRNEIGVLLPNMNVVEDSLEGLAEDCHKMVKRYFYSAGVGPLPFAIENMEGTTTADFREWLMVPQNGCMHMAAAEVVICHTLYSDIFQPYYVLNNDHTKALLNGLRRNGALRREAILRSQLALLTSQAEACDMALRAAASTADLLMTRNTEQHENFRKELGELFCRAVVLWQDVQRNETPFSVSHKVDRCWSTDETYEDYDSLITLTEEQKPFTSRKTNAVAVLFPQISVPGGDCISIICDGRALWSTQNTAVTAYYAYENTDRRGIPPPGQPSRQGATRRRRSSIATGSIVGREEISPINGNYSFELGTFNAGGIGGSDSQNSPGSPRGSSSPGSRSNPRSATIPRLNHITTRI